MYHGLEEIWAGFSKNIFPAFSRNIFLLAGVILMLFTVFVLPILWAVGGWIIGAGWAWLPLTSYLLLAGVRLGLTARFGRDTGEYALLNPLAWAVVIGIAINSAYQSLSGRGNAWKGRLYPKS